MTSTVMCILYLKYISAC